MIRIIKYNIVTNQYEYLTKYEDHGVRPQWHTQFVDHKHGMLYIFGADKESFLTFDLYTKEWEIEELNDNCYEPSYAGVHPSTTIHVSQLQQKKFIFYVGQNILSLIVICSVLISLIMIMVWIAYFPKLFISHLKDN